MERENPSTSIRLVAIDLDGTLLNSSRQVCSRAAAALRELRGRNVPVVIASARPPRSVRHIYHELQLSTRQINYNGALIWDEPSRRAIAHWPMDCALVRRVIDLARSRFAEVLVGCEILDRWHTDRFDAAHTTETGRLFKPDVIAPIAEICTQPITKLMLQGPPPMMDELETVLAGSESISFVRSDPDLIQIMDHQVSKATALRQVAAHYGVPMEHVMAIGDAANDIPMLEAAGVAVAMENAPPPVKAAADWVAPSNNDQGVHAALMRYGLTAGGQEV